MQRGGHRHSMARRPRASIQAGHQIPETSLRPDSALPSVNLFKARVTPDQSSDTAPEDPAGLSDELFGQIFSSIFADQPRTGATSRHLVLSKRLYTIIRPIWLRELEIVSSHAQVDIFLAAILEDRNVTKYIRSLHLGIFPLMSHTQSAALQYLRQLRALCITIQGQPQTSRPVVPAALMQGISKLPRLDSLTFVQPVILSPIPPIFPSTLKDISIAFVTLDTHVSAALRECPIVHAFLAIDGAETKTSTRSAYGQLPWDTLRTLNVGTMEKSCAEDLSVVLQALIDQVGRNRSLPRETIDD